MGAVATIGLCSPDEFGNRHAVFAPKGYKFTQYASMRRTAIHVLAAVNIEEAREVATWRVAECDCAFCLSGGVQ